MSVVVAVHGIAQQYRGESQMHDLWFPALSDGLIRADARNLVAASEFACAFYGDIFRPPGRPLSGNDPILNASAIEKGIESDLLSAVWGEAARIDRSVVPPNAQTLARTATWVQRALNALSKSSYFAGLTESLMIGALRQVRLYLTDASVRAAVQERVEATVTSETRVLIGHSLGSVVAYEALCAHPEWKVDLLLTLGSPLAIRNIVFERLLPRPARDADSGRLIGQWPGNVSAWSNIADAGDLVALRKDLRPYFGERVENFLVHNGSRAHDVRPYLATREVGERISSLLRQTYVE